MQEQASSRSPTVTALFGSSCRCDVLLCGPIARRNQPANGGFQSANLRNSKLLESLGFHVRHLYYPDSDVSAVRKALAYAMAFLNIYIVLALARRSILHITPLFRHFIGLELIAISVARMFGHHIVCDIRAGDQRDEYVRRSRRYQLLFRLIVRAADVVSVENERYIPFIKSIDNEIKVHVLPNFVPMDVVKRRLAYRNRPGPRLVFVGRVNDAKGIPQTLNLYRRLRQCLSEASLVIIGAGDANYMHRMIDATRDEQSIRILGPLDPSSIFHELDEADFFILLSAHPGEGHSNALTEAMARGCVPIVTKHGFMEEVVNNSGIIVSDRDDDMNIARQVVDAWRCERWFDLSRRATSRVERNYTDLAVRSVLLDMYHTFVLQHQAT